MQDWESANEFSGMNIHRNANIEDVNSEIRDTQNDDDDDEWWIDFVVWFTNERRSALFLAGTIVRDPQHRKSMTRRE